MPRWTALFQVIHYYPPVSLCSHTLLPTMLPFTPRELQPLTGWARGRSRPRLCGFLAWDWKLCADKGSMGTWKWRCLFSLSNVLLKALLSFTVQTKVHKILSAANTFLTVILQLDHSYTNISPKLILNHNINISLVTVHLGSPLPLLIAWFRWWMLFIIQTRGEPIPLPRAEWGSGLADLHSEYKSRLFPPIPRTKDFVKQRKHNTACI